MIAQSMMTKSNKSEYVTIVCPPSARPRNGWQNRLHSSLVTYIKFLRMPPLRGAEAFHTFSESVPVGAGAVFI